MAAVELHIHDVNESFCALAAEAFSGTGIIVQHGPLETAHACDAVVHAGNTHGMVMGGGGQDRAFLSHFGPSYLAALDAAFQSNFGGGEQPAGTVLVLPTGELCGHPIHKWVLHVRCFPHSPGTAYTAMAAVLRKVAEHNASGGEHRIRAIACSGLGTYSGCTHAAEVAAQMRVAYDQAIAETLSAGSGCCAAAAACTATSNALSGVVSDESSDGAGGGGSGAISSSSAAAEASATTHPTHAAATTHDGSGGAAAGDSAHEGISTTPASNGTHRNGDPPSTAAAAAAVATAAAGELCSSQLQEADALLAALQQQLRHTLQTDAEPAPLPQAGDDWWTIEGEQVAAEAAAARAAATVLAAEAAEAAAEELAEERASTTFLASIARAYPNADFDGGPLDVT